MRIKLYWSKRDISSGNIKHLTKRTVSDKVYRDKVFNIAKNPKKDIYHCGLA